MRLMKTLIAGAFAALAIIGIARATGTIDIPTYRQMLAAEIFYNGSSTPVSSGNPLPVAISSGGTVQPVPGTSGGCTPYHLSGGTAASTNSTSVKGSLGNLCDLVAINTTTTVYYLRLYDSASAPTCSSATGVKHVYPIPPAVAAGAAGGIVRSLALGESYANGIGFCVTGGSGDTDTTNAATGVFIEGSYK